MTPTVATDGSPSDPLKHLLPQHLDDLRLSGLSDEQIAACKFLSLSDAGKIDRLLRWPASRKGVKCGLVIPFPEADGKLNGYGRMKPDTPRLSSKDGSPVRYESPKGAANRAYFPPGTLAALADPTAPLVITEGEKKAAKADQERFPAIGLVGVWGWQKKRKDKDGPRALIPDLDAVAWEGRPIFLCYDSDLADKPDVAHAEWRLAEALTAKGVVVKIVRLPAGPEGAKVGLDDFLVAHGPDAFRQALEAAQPATPPKDDRPEIELGPLEFLCVAEGVKALAKGDKTLYQRGGQLVRVVRPCLPVESQRLRGSGGPKIETLPTADLRTRLTQTAHIVKIVQKKDQPPEKVLCHPPTWLVQGVEAAGRWPGVRPLEAVVTSPVLLPDGMVLQRPGYDAGSGLFYEANDAYQPIPERPTRADVEKARDALLEIVCDFPFARPEHRAAYVASVLTPLARFAFEGPAPLFLIDGNVRGTGKGLLADTAARVATGQELRPRRRRAGPRRDEEGHHGHRIVGRATGPPRQHRRCAGRLQPGRRLDGDRLAGARSLYGPTAPLAVDRDLVRDRQQRRAGGGHRPPGLPHPPQLYRREAGGAPRLPTCGLAGMGDAAKGAVAHGRLDDPVRLLPRRPAKAAAQAVGKFRGMDGAGAPGRGMGRPAGPRLDARDAGRERRPGGRGASRHDRRLEGDRPGQGRKDRRRGAGAVGGQGERGPLSRHGRRAVRGLRPGDRQATHVAEAGQHAAQFVGRNAGGECFDSREGHGGVKVWTVRDITDGGGGGGFGGYGGFGGSFSTHTRGREGADASHVSGTGEKMPSIPTIPTNGATAGGTPFVLVADAAGIEIVRAALEETAVVGLDTETTGLSPAPIAFGFSPSPPTRLRAARSSTSSTASP